MIVRFQGSRRGQLWSLCVTLRTHVIVHVVHEIKHVATAYVTLEKGIRHGASELSVYKGIGARLGIPAAG